MHKQINIKLFDINGKLIYSDTKKISKGNNNIIITLNNFSNGVYILNLQSDTKFINTKVIR